MTEQVDLDALEALAKAATPGPWVMTTQGGIEPHDYAGPGEDANSVAQVRHDRNWEYIAAANPATMLDLIAELRQERERAEGHKAAFLAASAERFETGKARDAFHDKALEATHAMNAAQDALSRAEETIEKASAEARQRSAGRLDILRILTEYQTK